ncbi:MAG: CRISPR-associated endonuclease Cas2 [Moraxellaceae bacterium]|nr:CRISPR-associated endonuclease Cas2 [Pseudomonadales bacterium]MCP5175183.1 CRISPR-associated endonuclease Cas2 [Moraxellaceae bacterium]
MNNHTPLLLCYDIRDPKRLQRVHNCVKKVGLALQYSVFYLEMSNADVTQLLNKLSTIIDASRDDIRTYAISRFEDITLLGASLLADGIQMFTHGEPILKKSS